MYFGGVAGIGNLAIPQSNNSSNQHKGNIGSVFKVI